MAHVVKKACIPDVSFAVAAWAGSNWHYVKIIIDIMFSKESGSKSFFPFIIYK